MSQPRPGFACSISRPWLLARGRRMDPELRLPIGHWRSERHLSCKKATELVGQSVTTRSRAPHSDTGGFGVGQSYSSPGPVGKHDDEARIHDSGSDDQQSEGQAGQGRRGEGLTGERRRAGRFQPVNRPVRQVRSVSDHLSGRGSRAPLANLGDVRYIPSQSRRGTWTGSSTSCRAPSTC